PPPTSSSSPQSHPVCQLLASRPHPGASAVAPDRPLGHAGAAAVRPLVGPSAGQVGLNRPFLPGSVSIVVHVFFSGKSHTLLEPSHRGPQCRRSSIHRSHHSRTLLRRGCPLSTPIL